MNDINEEINLALQEVYEQLSQLQQDRDELVQHILSLKNENRIMKEKLEIFEKKLDEKINPKIKFEIPTGEKSEK